MSDSSQTKGDLQINGVVIDRDFAEAFDMKATRIIITAADHGWVRAASAAMTGFGTSVIACGVEIAVEQHLAPELTPDGRPGVSVLMFGMSGDEIDKQMTRRLGQCVLTCPTTAVFAGFPGGRKEIPKRVPLGKAIRFFGDGNQISKVTGGSRFWRIPVMDGEFFCEHDVGRVSGIGGGNFIMLGESTDSVSLAARAAVDAMNLLPDVILPFPGGVARSGSKVGSKYPEMFASTNDAFCPTLRWTNNTQLDAQENVAMEIVIDGLSFQAISNSIRVGVKAACQAAGNRGLSRITAGNYGGKLGKHHFHLHEVMS